MKILVIGGSGFIGSHIVDELVSMGYDVVVVDKNKNHQNKKSKYYKADITNYKKIENVFRIEKPDIVNHHAVSMVDPRESNRYPKREVWVTVEGTLNILKCCKKYETKKLIFASSSSVYGSVSELPIKESVPKNPISAYGTAKLAAENYIRLYLDNYTILRYSNIYGPRQVGTTCGIIAILIRKYFSGERPVIFGDGSQTRDYLYVSDAVSANILSIEKGDNEIFNIGSMQEISLKQILDMLSDMKLTIEPIYAEEKKGDMKRLCLDTRMSKRILGWKQKICLRDGIEKTLKYYRKIHGY